MAICSTIFIRYVPQYSSDEGFKGWQIFIRYVPQYSSDMFHNIHQMKVSRVGIYHLSRRVIPNYTYSS